MNKDELKELLERVENKLDEDIWEYSQKMLKEKTKEFEDKILNMKPDDLELEKKIILASRKLEREIKEKMVGLDRII